MATVQLTILNRYSVIKEDNTDESPVSYTAVGNEVVENNPYDKNKFINHEGLKEQNKVFNKDVRNPSGQPETPCMHELSYRSRDSDRKRCFKISTLINGSIIMSGNDMFLQSHRRDIIIKNPINSVQLKVLILGHCHSWGSVIKLRTALSAK
jgi:hypothetical protein